MPIAMLAGVKTGNSPPQRISRGRGGQRVNMRRLYPRGGGAGYFGGIMSRCRETRLELIHRATLGSLSLMRSWKTGP